MNLVPRTCPICLKIVPIDHEFHFDENMNIIHDICGFKLLQDNSEIKKNIEIFNKLNNIDK
jgi:hypothetical protein